MSFLGWFLQYFIIFIILAAIAVLGIFCGKKLSERSAAKKAALAAESDVAATVTSEDKE